jgi:hypothetical protein
MLALGAVSHKLQKHGNIERARRNIDKVHELLGYHGERILRETFYGMILVKTRLYCLLK